MEIIESLSSRLSFRFELLKYALPYIRHELRCKVLELTHPGYLKKIRKADIEPIFIVGAGRSGNTLLARLLHETGGVHFGPENFTLSSTYLKYLQCIDAPWEKRVERILDLLANQEDNWRWEKVDVAAVREYLLASDEHTLGNIIHAWYLHYGHGIGYPSERWGCKTPNLTPFMSDFIKVFPNTRVVQVLRRPGGVVASFLKAGIKPYDSKITAYVHWLYFNDYLRKIRRKIIRFSELTANPERVIQMLMNDLGINAGGIHIPFDNPDLAYEHLTNVNSRVEKKDGTGTLHDGGSVERILEGLERKYESY